MAGYSSLVSARKICFSQDGTIVGYDSATAAAYRGLVNVCSAGDLLQLDGESPAEDTSIVTVASNYLTAYALFPELRDLSYMLLRYGTTSSTTNPTHTVATSPDTTNGIDGSWTTITVTGTLSYVTNNVDWWRANAPASLSGAVTGIKGVRFQTSGSTFGTGTGWRGWHIWGHKYSGQTPDDIVFLDTGLTTEFAADYDFGDVLAASATQDITIAVKNVSGTKTANSIVLTMVGSNPSDYLISIDAGSTFGSTKTITSLAAGATQNVVLRLAPPAATAGNYTPRAANLKASVTSWT